ncbi:MAG: inorganic phosphate transporter [DPANN group archaeon]|nr:inorganic phosphate transporter [DPANN group archaeon]
MVLEVILVGAATLFLLYFMGGNAAGHITGPLVGCRVLKFKKAVIFSAVSVFIGALLQGHVIRAVVGKGIVSNLQVDSLGVTIVLLSAAVWVCLATIFGWPVSISQSTIGAIIGFGLVSQAAINWPRVATIFGGVVLNPIFAAVLTMLIYAGLHKFFPSDDAEKSSMWSIPLLLSTIYASYTLGANTFNSVVGVAANVVRANWLLAAGTIALGLGILIFGKKVIKTAGFEVTHLNPMTAFIVQLSGALVLHGFIYLGIPSTATLAVIGSIFGVGVFRKLKDNVQKQSVVRLWQAMPSQRKSTIFRILFSWFVTPLFVAGLAAVLYILIKII